MRLGRHNRQRWNEGRDAATLANKAYDRMIEARGENGSPTIEAVAESVSFLIHDRRAGELIGIGNFPDEIAPKLSQRLSLRGLNVVAGMGKEIYRGCVDTGTWPSVKASTDSQSPAETVKIPN